MSPKFTASVEKRRIGWLGVPAVTLVTDPPITMDELPEGCTVQAPDGRSLPVEDLVQRMRNGELDRLIAQGAFDQMKDSETKKVTVPIILNPRSRVRVGDQNAELVRILIDGSVLVRVENEMPTMKVLISERDGSPHVACMIGELPSSHLVGVAFSSRDQDPHIVQIAVSDRNLGKINRLKLPRREKLGI